MEVSFMVESIKRYKITSGIIYGDTRHEGMTRLILTD